MGALTDWGTLPSLPRCSDERRDWIAAPCVVCAAMIAGCGNRIAALIGAKPQEWEGPRGPAQH